jgi:transcriptional regulator with XRE-family HTH domain
MAPRAAPKKTRPAGDGESLADRIARLRKERGYTQVELASRIGSVQVVISDYERAKLRPNPEMIVELARAFGVSTDELLGARTLRTGPEPIVNRRLLRRLRAIDKLPQRDQDAIIRTIDAFLGRERSG